MFRIRTTALTSWKKGSHAVVVAAVLLVIACAADPTPTLSPTATAMPNPTATSSPTATPTPTPVPTPTPELAATPTPTAEPDNPTFEAEHIPEEFNAGIAKIKGKMESVEPLWTVYIHSNDWQTPGRNTVMGAVFDLLKLENIVAHEGYRRIDPEQVVAAEPDIIIADSLESIVENPKLSDLHMAQDPEHIPHHIFVLGESLSFDVDDHHFMDAVEELAAFVYPEVFAREEDDDSDGGHGHGDEDSDSDHGEAEGSGHDDDSDSGHSHGDEGSGHDEDENHTH